MRPARPRLPTARQLALVAPLLAALAAGSLLRLWNLPAQVMAGDELHAVRAALARPVAGILFTYQAGSDNCIPLTLWDRLLLDSGARLSEWMVRLPVLLSGLALLVAAPWWAWRRLGRGPAVVLGWLLAVSPALVFYARIARPYAPATLLAFGALAAFDAWLARPRWGTGVAYVAFATLALWFHLGVGPLVVSPLLVGGAAVLVRRGRDALGLLLLGAGTAAAFLALLLPARGTLLPLVAAKHGTFALLPGEASEVAALLAGVRSPLAAAAFWLLLAGGLVRLARGERRLAALAVAAVAGQVAGIVALAPVAHRSAIVLERYLVPALPWALMAAPALLGRPWPGPWRRAQPLVAALAVGALVALGPFRDPSLLRSPFAHEPESLRFTAPRLEVPAGTAPEVYAWLAQAARGAVLEAPWHPVWRFSRAAAIYQRAHGREVVVASSGPVFGDPRLGFRNMVPSLPARLLASRARWLVLHRDLAAEEARLPPVDLPDDVAGGLRAGAAQLAVRLRRAWGRPDHVDAQTLCWDLERVRRRLSRRASASRGGFMVY